MNRLIVGVAGLAAAVALAGCGTGQIAQTTEKASAVNGAEGAAGKVVLRNVRLEAVQTGDSIPAGSTVDLAFVASNQSADVPDELVKISTDIGKVSPTGTKKLPAGGVLIVNPPTAKDAMSPAALKQLRDVEDASAATATVALDEPIRNGLTYEFTFEFKHAGPITVKNVPVSAAEAAQAAAPKPHH